MASMRSWAAGAVAAAAVAVGGTEAAHAGTYGPFGCSLNHGHACITGQRHTYNDNKATAPTWAYVASWLRNPSTGTDISVVWGYGLASAWYRNNTDLWLDGYWGNYSGVSPVTVVGTFNY
jgi:hypothetical protein